MGSNEGVNCLMVSVCGQVKSGGENFCMSADEISSRGYILVRKRMFRSLSQYSGALGQTRLSLLVIGYIIYLPWNWNALHSSLRSYLSYDPFGSLMVP